MRALGCALALVVLGCASCPAPAPRSCPAPAPRTGGDRAPIDAVLDDWHLAAAESDLERYFGHLTADAIFLGTDATERWDPVAFRAYAEAPFGAGRGWRMRSVRRDVVVRDEVAWFDEDLEATNLGPARGSGVLVRDPSGVWRIAHYNLAITVPNDRFEEVREVLRAAPDETEGRPRE